jgi:hypothetical protein
MTENTFFLSRSFLRSYGLVAAWSAFGAGILLLTGRFSLVAGFLLLAGLTMAFFAFRGSSLREGAYPRARVWVMMVTILGTLCMGLLLRFFARGQSLAIWWMYLIGILALLVYSAVEFSRSIRGAD